MRAFAYRFFLVVCTTALGLGVIATLLDGKQGTVNLKKLRDLSDLQTVPMSQVLNKPVEIVCALDIYQLRLRDDGPFRDRINALLKSGDFGFFGRSTWFFVFVLGDSATVQNINAHRDQLYLTTDDAGLPGTFTG